MALMSIQTNTGPCRCAHGTLPLHSGKVGISQKRPDGEPAAAARGPSKCQRQYYVVVLEQLLEGGIDVNAVDWKGRPALYFACARGDGAAAKMLLSKGADVDAAFHIARCSESPAIKVLWRAAYPLHHAGSNGRLQDVEGFLREGEVDVNASDHKGPVPLHETSRKGHLHVLRALLPTRSLLRLSPAVELNCCGRIWCTVHTLSKYTSLNPGRCVSKRFWTKSLCFATRMCMFCVTNSMVSRQCAPGSH